MVNDVLFKENNTRFLTGKCVANVMLIFHYVHRKQDLPVV